MNLHFTPYFFLKMIKLWLIVNLIVLILCSGASLPKLHQDEVSVLKEIGRKLGKSDWDFSKDPCGGGEGNWIVPFTTEIFESNVTCDCSFAQNSTCHVVRIALKAQNLTGILPPEFAKLRHLTHLDLSRNLLNGSIPLEWATMRLVDMSLMDNRLSGPFPKIITGITSLVNLSLEGNMFTGSIPSEIGQLVNLQKLILSSNEFTGELPLALVNLTSLANLKISDNNFTGRIPDFISSWTHIQQLHIQGCSLDGPIPSSIFVLTNLTDLRISDLAGGRSKFPLLSNLKSIKVLILRSCLLDDEIPAYIGNMKKLKTLDLSFNNLTGKIPASFVHLKDVNFMYLTGNRLTGLIPQWVLSSTTNIDLSSNNFTEDASSIGQCAQEHINLVESYSSTANNLYRLLPCLKQEFPCSDLNNQRYSMHINCGGRCEMVGNTLYDADEEIIRASALFDARSNWYLSNTGNFLDNQLHYDAYILSNRSVIYNASRQESIFYRTARVSPLSLTYYGTCLFNGNYTVRLSFVEIVFTNDSTFNSLGRRVFDVYIQGKLLLKDFNIANEAGGPGIPVIKKFTIPVTSHTLKIHLYWAGKGTTTILNGGMYGPLISAISVDPDFKPPVHHKKISHGLAIGIVAWIVTGVLCIIAAVCLYQQCIARRTLAHEELRGLERRVFTLREIQAATGDFDDANRIGDGGFGPVYKGTLVDGTVVAVKQLLSNSGQGQKEFSNEVETLYALQHPNIVKLHGSCAEGSHHMLVYEYMENNSLKRAISGERSNLDWSTRRQIVLGLARGLAYLHEESSLNILHGDIKPANILLDRDMNAKISDFGLARRHTEQYSRANRLVGTFGYMAPEYALEGKTSFKADVYSFGLVVIELFNGKNNIGSDGKLEKAKDLIRRNCLSELIDSTLGSNYSSEEATMILKVALLCIHRSPDVRPNMTDVVSMLVGEKSIDEIPSTSSEDESDIEALRMDFWEIARGETSRRNKASGTRSVNEITEEE